MALDDLRAELEKLYELEELMELCRNVLGLDPDDIGGTAAKGSFAKAIVERCSADEAIEALADAVVVQRGDDARLFGELRREGLPHSEEIESGDSIGAFVVIRKLGEGKAGISYLAQHEGRDVRLKVLRRRVTLDKSALQRFLFATRLQGTLQHPGIPSGIWAGTVEDRWAVCHDWVEGETLAEQVGRLRGLPFIELRGLVRPILDALSQMHARRLAHGDLSLENVLLHENGGARVVLLDTGTYHLHASGLGSSKTAAPEQVRGKSPDARSDVYSFAALLFELLTGKPPFVGDSEADALAGRLTRPPARPSVSAPPGRVSGELDELILRMLDKDPAKRPRTAAVVLDALEALDLGAFVQVAAMPDDELDALLQALIDAPDDEQAADELEAALAQGGDPKRVAEGFRLVADLRGATDVQRRLLLRAARIYETARLDRIGAEQVLSELCQLDPSDEASERALLDLRRQLGKWTEVVEMLLEQSERTTDRSARARILAEIGKLYAVELDDKTQALVAYTEAFCQDPKQASYATEVERLAGSNHAAWSEALELCVQSTAGAMPVEMKNLLWVRMARWYADRVNRPDLALPCYAEVLSKDGANDAALEGTAAIYRAANRWSELGSVLLARADVTTRPALARDLRAEAAGILERELGQVPSARDLYERIFAEDPSHESTGDALTRIYESTGDPQSALKVLERRANAVRGEPRHTLLCRAAELFEGPLMDLSEAIRRYEAVLAEEPGHHGALRGLDRAHTTTGDFDELLAFLERQLGLATTPRQKAALWERMAEVYATEFLDHERAREAWEQVLEYDPRRLQAFAALPKHYKALERWEELAELYQRQLRIISDREQRIAIGLELGSVLSARLEATERASSAYEGVLEIQPEHAGALEALAKLRASTGDASRALEALEALAANAATPAAKAEQYCRAARLLEERGEMHGAIERYKLALDAVPNDTSTSKALRAAYVACGDAKAAVELVDKEIAETEGARARAKLLGEKARLCWERLGDEPAAEAAARLTISEDPTNLDALTVLGDIAFNAARFLEAAKQYEQVSNRLNALETTEAARVVGRHAEALAKSGSADKAVEKAEWLVSLSPDDRAALRVAADLIFEHGEPGRAYELYKELAGARDDLSDRDVAAVMYGLGESARRMRRFDTARGPLEEAILRDPTSPLAYRALARVFEAKERWSDVVAVLYRQLDVLSGKERVALLIEIGDLVSAKLHDADYAAKMFLAALYENPDDRNILMKLMRLYGEAEDWGHLLQVIRKLAELVEDPKQKAKYLKTAGEIAAKQLRDNDLAIRLLDRAVELDPSSEGAIEEALYQHRAYGNAQEIKQLLKHRIALALAKNDTPKMLASMTELANLYLDYFSDVRQAVAVCEEMQQIAPSPERTELLAKLYASRPDEYFDKAIAAYHAVLRDNPYYPEAYRALRRLYTEARFPDGAWCLCQALTLLNLADVDERNFFDRMRLNEAAPASVPLTETDWATLVIHADVDPLLTGILAVIEPAVIANRSGSVEKLGYRKEHALDVTQNSYGMVHSLAWAAEVLAMQLPPLFHNANSGGGLSFLHATQPSIVLGRAALRSDLPSQATAFIAGQQLTHYRPGHYVRHLLPSGTALKSWLLAAVKLIAPQFPVAPELERPIREALTALETAVTGPFRDHLASIVSRLLQQNVALDLKRWIAGVDLTADRAGLLLCNDLEVAVELVRASREDSSSVAAADRIQALVLYSVSVEYFHVRKRLKISVEPTR
jgi:tetratricopeptide (TPR) repeat protein